MKIFIWDGCVSSSHHDDGTLVVLANDLEEAQRIAQRDVSELKSGHDCDLTNKRKFPRPADEIMELDKPELVAFNGGGYD